MSEVNYNTGGKILDMEMLMRTPLYVVRHKFGKGVLYFMECSREEAKRMIIDNHYSHKFICSFGEVNIGVYKDGRLVGVASYGRPLDYNSDTEELIELNRMWLSDELGRNAESILISVSIKMLRRLKPKLKFIQSFSDGRLGCGIVYQSANFKYYGFIESVFSIDEDGTQSHRMTIESLEYIDKFLSRMEQIAIGKTELLKVKTHRYIFELDKDVKYPKEEVPYPKEDGGYQKIKFHESLKTAFIRAYLLNKALGKDYNYYEDVLRKNVTDYESKLTNYKSYVLKHIERQIPDKYENARKLLGFNTDNQLKIPTLVEMMGL